jgi:NAD(P)H-dependent flavin oxidoreductase YrpB (nitropropane dioxygenase family)
MELPGPPRRGMSKQERKAIAAAEKMLRELLPSMRRLNQLTDTINDQVDVRSVDRDMQAKVAALMWQGEFIERILSHSQPVFATMEIVKWMARLNAVDVEVKEMTVEEAQAGGYL